MEGVTGITCVVLLVVAIVLLLGKGTFLIHGFRITGTKGAEKFDTRRLGMLLGMFLLYVDVLVFLQWIQYLSLSMSRFCIVASCIVFFLFITFTDFAKKR